MASRFCRFPGRCRLGSARGSAHIERVRHASVRAAQVRLDSVPSSRIDGEAMVWTGVTAADGDESLLVVLTESEPVLHLFDLAAGTARRSWGRHGEKARASSAFPRAWRWRASISTRWTEHRRAWRSSTLPVTSCEAWRFLNWAFCPTSRLGWHGPEAICSCSRHRSRWATRAWSSQAFGPDPGGDSAPRQDTVVAYQPTPDPLRLSPRRVHPA